MQFSPLSRHLIPLRSKILLSTLFSNTLSLCSFLNVRDQVSHPYRTTDKIIILYILTLKLFHSRREDTVSYIRDWLNSTTFIQNWSLHPLHHSRIILLSAHEANMFGMLWQICFLALSLDDKPNYFTSKLIYCPPIDWFPIRWVFLRPAYSFQLLYWLFVRGGSIRCCGKTTIDS
jgi:hypothetical protein